MKTCKPQSKSHTSPWTEVYKQFCEQDSRAHSASTAERDEQAPTQEALASVYSRPDTSRERF